MSNGAKRKEKLCGGVRGVGGGEGGGSRREGREGGRNFPLKLS